jgi:hypothetical protein
MQNDRQFNRPATSLFTQLYCIESVFSSFRDNDMNAIAVITLPLNVQFRSKGETLMPGCSDLAANPVTHPAV